MSRSALILSLVLHAGVMAIAGWSSLLTFSHAGPGKTEIGVAFSSEDAGGLVVEDAPPAAPALAQITPPAVESSFIPPPPAIEVHPAPLAPADPVPPPLTAVTGLPRELPSISPPKKARPAARTAASSAKGPSAATSIGAGGGSAIGAGHGGGGGPGFVPPQFLMRYKPPYPEEARAQKLEGVVLLLVSVDAAGRVTSAQLSQSCGHEVLDHAALSAVRSWRFTPARQADRPVPATVEVPIRFHFAA